MDLSIAPIVYLSLAPIVGLVLAHSVPGGPGPCTHSEPGRGAK